MHLHVTNHDVFFVFAPKNNQKPSDINDCRDHSQNVRKPYRLYVFFATFYKRCQRQPIRFFLKDHQQTRKLCFCTLNKRNNWYFNYFQGLRNSQTRPVFKISNWNAKSDYSDVQINNFTGESFFLKPKQYASGHVLRTSQIRSSRHMSEIIFWTSYCDL